MPDDSNQRLEGWVAIAHYFQVTPRAAQMWERDHGMPVHRFQRRVFAYGPELDRWRAANELVTNGEGADEGPPPPEPVAELSPALAVSEPGLAVPPSEPEESSSPAATALPRVGAARRRVLAVIATGLGLVALVSWVLIEKPWRPPRNPTSLTGQGRMLRVFDQYNEPLWDTVLPVPLDENFANAALDLSYTWWKFADLDGDGLNELLLPLSMKGARVLFCFDHRGRPFWKQPYQMGRDLERLDGSPAPNIFAVRHVELLSKPRPDGGLILVGGFRGPTSAYMVELITRDARRVAEYVHPGWMFAIKAGDIDGDGVDEVVLGGVNDARRDRSGPYCTLVVLDSRRIEGQGWSPPGDSRRFAKLSAGAERAILFFPDFGPGQDRPFEYSRVHAIKFENQRLTVRVGRIGVQPPVAEFEFDRHLQITGAVPNTPLFDWILAHPELVAKSKAPGIDPSERFLRNIEVMKNDFAVPGQK